jgi:dienelactone hydrolase
MSHRRRTSSPTALTLLALLLVCAVAPAPAAAHGTCREGEHALDDERALAAFRAALEESCPCDAYDGSAGRNRRDYRACATDALARAEADGTLGEACVAVAREQIEGSVCGTRGVACASVVGTAAPRATCKVTSAASCRSVAGRRPRLPELAGPAATRPTSPLVAGGAARTACTEQDFCTDVVEWTAGTCFDTRDEGPYAAGFRDVRLVKDSVAEPGTERVLNAVAWYPTTRGAGPIESDSRAVRDAPLDASRGPYPVLMFSHGSCGFERQSLFLTPWLATHGFIVVAVPHPGNTLFEFPACRTSDALTKSATERPRDVVFALDWILAADANPASPFFGAVDETRLGMSGHSFGGLTTYLTTAIDDRFTVAVPMAAATGPRSELHVPSLTLYGEIDSVVSNPGIFAAYERSTGPKRLVGIEDAGHYAFSDGCFPGADCDPPVTLTQDEAHERVKRQILPFLKVYLAGDRAWAPFLTTAPPPGASTTVE